MVIFNSYVKLPEGMYHFGGHLFNEIRIFMGLKTGLIVGSSAFSVSVDCLKCKSFAEDSRYTLP